MIRNLFRITFFAVLCLTLTSCLVQRGQPSAQSSNLTPGAVKAFIVKGKTTQAQINQHFGAPNLVTSNSSGKQVWSYNKMSNSDSSSSSAAGFLFVGASSSQSSQTTRSFDLIITFNSKDIVENYKMIASTY